MRCPRSCRSCSRWASSRDSRDCHRPVPARAAVRRRLRDRGTGPGTAGLRGCTPGPAHRHRVALLALQRHISSMFGWVVATVVAQAVLFLPLTSRSAAWSRCASVPHRRGAALVQLVRRSVVAGDLDEPAAEVTITPLRTSCSVLDRWRDAVTGSGADGLLGARLVTARAQRSTRSPSVSARPSTGACSHSVVPGQGAVVELVGEHVGHRRRSGQAPRANQPAATIGPRSR